MVLEKQSKTFETQRNRGNGGAGIAEIARKRRHGRNWKENLITKERRAELNGRY
jgi:hypothetical protein